MYNGTKVLDMHGHVTVPNAALAYGFLLMATNSASKSPLSPGRKDDLTEEQYRATAETHVNILDKCNIDVQVLGPRPYTQFGFMEPHLIPSWTAYTNDTIAQQVRMFPDRFVGAAMLPQDSDAPDTGHCLDELERCVTEYGFQAVYVGPDPKGLRTTPGMHDPYWYPLYERCQDRHLPIIVHGTNYHDPRLAPIPSNMQLGFVIEQYIANQLLSHTDVFKRFPELRVVICHCGGALDRFAKTDWHLSQEDYSENLYYDTCAFDLDFLAAAIKQRGVNRMLFGTETSGNLVQDLSNFDFLTEDDRLDILNRNVLKVFPGLAKI